jgi:hypothetical protein
MVKRLLNLVRQKIENNKLAPGQALLVITPTTAFAETGAAVKTNRGEISLFVCQIL